MPSLTLLLALAALAGAQSSPVPPPPLQSPVQKAVMASTAKAACAASAKAAPALLALLESADFSAALGGCCPELQGCSPAELLQLYSAQVAVTEVAHGFFATNRPRAPAQNNAADVNLTQAANATWFYNEWQLQVVFPGKSAAEVWEVIGGSCSLGPAAAAELGIFGLPSFSAKIPQVPGAFPGGWPASLAEASDRVVYTEFNQRRTALPCSPWGDVNVIFAPALTRETVILSPFDTGDYEVRCNTTYREEMDKAFARDCALQYTQAGCETMGYMCEWNGTACRSERSPAQTSPRAAGAEAGAAAGAGGGMCNWTLQMGTLKDHNHVLLDYATLSSGGGWPRSPSPGSGAASTLGALFKGMFEPTANRSDGGFTNSYFEAGE